MTALDNVITFLILLTLGILAYVKITNKTLIDFFREVKEIFSGGEEIEQVS